MFLQSLRLFSLAESLVEHSAIMTRASVDADAREALGITDGLVRLSVGIEDSDDLLGDLDQALSTIQTAPPPVYSMAARS
jgi:cystathionine beta-lyase/cystathionine gamma-synthase